MSGGTVRAKDLSDATADERQAVLQSLLASAHSGGHSGSWSDTQSLMAHHMLAQQPDGDRRRVVFQPMNPICDAAEQGDLPTLTRLVATDAAKVNTKGENGNTALAFACANGHADCTAFLRHHFSRTMFPSLQPCHELHVVPFTRVRDVLFRH